MIKYLFKYINKGADRTRAMITENILVDDNTREQWYEQVNEIKTYLDYRYLSVYEATWRLFQFDIHFKEPIIE